MNPQQLTAGGLPLLKILVFNKPSGGTIVMGVASNVMVYRWVWWRKPTPKLLL